MNSFKLTNSQQRQLKKLPKLEQILTMKFLQEQHKVFHKMQVQDRKVKILRAELGKRNKLGIATMEETYYLENEINLLEKYLNDIDLFYEKYSLSNNHETKIKKVA